VKGLFSFTQARVWVSTHPPDSRAGNGMGGTPSLPRWVRGKPVKYWLSIKYGGYELMKAYFIFARFYCWLKMRFMKRHPQKQQLPLTPSINDRDLYGHFYRCGPNRGAANTDKIW